MSTQTKAERLAEIKTAKKQAKKSSWEDRNKLAKKLKGTRKSGKISKLNFETKKVRELELNPQSLILNTSSIKYTK